MISECTKMNNVCAWICVLVFERCLPVGFPSPLLLPLAPPRSSSFARRLK